MEGTTRAHVDDRTRRPELDGVRAIAVYLVLAFHSGASRASGGFIGVDVFFVLSGFLVTRSLLSNRTRSGSFDLRRFYSRRVRRLLPAAALNLVATALVFRWLASPVEAQAAIDSMRAAALYVSNWWFIAEQADYFGSSIEANPVLHYWSLSVEEQFYVLWPLLLLGSLWVAGRVGGAGRRAVAGLVAGLAAASLVAALVIERTDPGRAYYGTDTRAYQLLAGAVLALLPGIIARVGRDRSTQLAAAVACAVATAGLLVLGTSAVSLTPVRRGALATIATLALLVGLEAAPRNPVRRVLSIRGVAFLGRISYGTYLWHWIVVQVLVRKLELSPMPVFAASAVVATGIATLSFELVERPILEDRRTARFPVPAIACGVAASVLIAMVIVPRTLDRVATSDVVIEASDGTPVTLDVSTAVARSKAAGIDCPVDSVAICLIRGGTGSKVLLIGDSHALTMAAPFRVIAERNDLQLAGSFMRYCPWMRGLAYYWPDPGRCFGLQERAFDEDLPSFDPDVVVLVGLGFDDPVHPVDLIDQSEGLLRAGEGRREVVAERIRSVVEDLRSQGRRVVLVEPIPVPDPQITTSECLSGARYVEECRMIASVAPTAQESVLRSMDDRDDGVWALDLDRLVCPYLPICDPIVRGRMVREDPGHISNDFAAALADEIEEFLRVNGVLPLGGQAGG